MERSIQLWVALALSAVLVSTAVVSPLLADASPADSPILLNEIMADPAQDWDADGLYNFKDDEWVEIVNNGSAPVVLEGYRLSGADTTWRYEFTGTLNPGEVRVVFGSQSLSWEIANGEAQFGLRLSNTGGYLALWHLAGDDTTLADCYTYGDHEAEDDRSTGRVPDGADTWRVYDGLNLYEGSDLPLGTGCLPSPGTTISCPTPVESKTWGRVKALFPGGN